MPSDVSLCVCLSPYAVCLCQRDFLAKTLGTLPAGVLKDLAQRMVLVRKDEDGASEGDQSYIAR